MMQTEDKEEERNLPSLRTSLIAPVVTIVLLALRPAAGINIDPLIALPVGGFMWCYLYETMEKYSSEYRIWTAKDVCGSYSVDRNRNYCRYHKELFFERLILTGLDHAHMSDALIAPISGALMSAATASTTAGATLASSSFAETILAIGISAVWGSGYD